jgi:hypothetical protein
MINLLTYIGMCFVTPFVGFGLYHLLRLILSGPYKIYEKLKGEE